MTTLEMLKKAKAAAPSLAESSGEKRREALEKMADALILHQEEILRENRQDVEKARESISAVMIDRLTLNASRIDAMAQGIREVAQLPDPLGRVLSHTERPNGLIIEKVAVPMGVIAIIFESRPNVTADAAALALRSGNACVLRAGKEAFHSANAIVRALKSGIREAGLSEDLLHLVQDTSRQSAQELMTAVGLVDLLIPRGGAGLIQACVDNAKVPCVQTGTGICHVYVDKAADLEMAVRIIENAKTSRPSVCNAEEVLLLHRDIAEKCLPRLVHLLTDERKEQGKIPVEFRLDERAQAIACGLPAGEKDFDTEFLDYILAVAVVDSLDEAIEHIAGHSTGHSEAIITADEAAARRFTARVDSAAVYVNASTRFTDGGEFGLGCEMGISTQKLHARGPMGLEELTCYKYVIYGNGQIR